MFHKSLKTVVGVNIAILAAGITMFGPFPSLAANTGGNFEVVVATAGEVHLATDKAVQVPLAHYYISQGFWVFHPGIDMASETGEPIRPMMAGKVVHVEKGWFGYGNHVIVAHDKEYKSLYAHMSKILVNEGDQVTTETELGLVGSTGHSTGPHLHLEVYEDGKPIDPRGVLGIK